MNYNPAPFNDDNNEYIVKKNGKNIKKNTTQNRTIKRRKEVKNMKVNDFLESMTNENENDSENEDFSEVPYLNPPQLFSKKEHPPSISNVEYNPDIFSKVPLQENMEHKMEQDIQNRTQNDTDNDVSQSQYKNMSTHNGVYKEYFNNYVPYFKNASNPQEIHGSKDVLLEKINYMIHLLEEQQEEKTGHVTEELILYSFLGVFVIFVIDSFVKVGKYVR
jgi:hypothetical protein